MNALYELRALVLGCSDAAGLYQTSDIPLPDWTPDLSLAYMDTFDISGAILSLSSPGTPYGDLSKARSMARQVCELYSFCMLYWLAERVKSVISRVIWKS